jgi:hypothetical protein
MSAMESVAVSASFWAAAIFFSVTAGFLPFLRQKFLIRTVVNHLSKFSPIQIFKFLKIDFGDKAI